MTPDLVELSRRLTEAANRHDFDTAESFYAPDAVWRGTEIGTFEGAAAIRGLVEDMVSPYEEWEMESEAILDLGNGVVFSVVIQKARLVDSSGEVRLRSGVVGEWAHGLIVRMTFYTDIDEARAAAERLAEERAQVDA